MDSTNLALNPISLNSLEGSRDLNNVAVITKNNLVILLQGTSHMELTA
jgi:hypothetical protein